MTDVVMGIVFGTFDFSDETFGEPKFERDIVLCHAENLAPFLDARTDILIDLGFDGGFHGH